MNRTKILALGLVITLAMAGAGIAVAQTASKTAPAPAPAQSGASLIADSRGGEEAAMDAESPDGQSGEGGDPAALGTPAIGYDQAVKAAEAYAKKGTALSVALEDENGSLVYAVQVNGADIKVDAATGSIVKVDGGETADREAAGGDNAGNDGENRD